MSFNIGDVFCFEIECEIFPTSPRKKPAIINTLLIAVMGAKLDEITIEPEVKESKSLLDKKNKDHRYLMEED